MLLKFWMRPSLLGLCKMCDSIAFRLTAVSRRCFPHRASGGRADLLRRITLTDWAIVDKQLDSMPVSPRSSPLCRLTACCCAVICWGCARWQPFFISHFHYAIKGSSGVEEAALCWPFSVIITLSRTGWPNREKGWGGGGCNHSQGSLRP